MKSFGRSFANTFTNTFPSSFQVGYRSGEEQRQQNLLMAMKQEAERQRAIEEEKKFQADQQYKKGQLLNSLSDDYSIKPSEQFIPYRDATQATPKNAMLGEGFGLSGYTLIPKEKVEKEKNPIVKIAENPETGRPGFFDVTNNKWLEDDKGKFLIAKEEGGLSALAEYNINKERADDEQKRAQAQSLYNDLLDTYDEQSKKYIVTTDAGKKLIFNNDKEIERYAKSRVLQLKPPGRINFWTRSKNKKNNDPLGIR